MYKRFITTTAFVALLAGAALAQPAAPAAPPEDKDKDSGTSIGEVVVTGSMVSGSPMNAALAVTAMSVRQGGAQDINHFRGEADAQRIPFPDTLTPEGLMGDYDLRVPGEAPCAQLFCLTGQAMKASLLTRPDDSVFVGLGFNSNLDAATWKRRPLNLVAVVDKSGSMNGAPLELVRKSLKQIVGQLQPGDQIGIVLYGDRSYRHLDPTPVTAANRKAILASIDAIASAGSTNMEAGLRVGYDTAFASAGEFDGVTRVMLFTDEQPNVDATDAETFMGMAQAASNQHIGLTTVGVGVQYDAALATKIASVRGGNLYFMRDEADVRAVFAQKLDTMVSELAYDIEIVIRPNPAYRVSGVYGVPGDLLDNRPDGAVAIVVPTAFLSTNGGGIFVSLAKAEAAAYLPQPQLRSDETLLNVALSYVSARDGGRGSDSLTIAQVAAKPADGVRLGHALIDEFLALKQATTLFHVAHDTEGAYQMFRQISYRLDQAPDSRLSRERKMMGSLLTQAAFLSGHSAEPPRTARFLGLTGTWEVTRIEGFGRIDLRRGDRLTLDGEESAEIMRRKGGTYDSDGAETYHANNRQLFLDDSNQLFEYELDGQRLTLRHDTSEVTVMLKKVAEVPAADVGG